MAKGKPGGAKRSKGDVWGNVTALLLCLVVLLFTLYTAGTKQENALLLPLEKRFGPAALKAAAVLPQGPGAGGRQAPSEHTAEANGEAEPPQTEGLSALAQALRGYNEHSQTEATLSVQTNSSCTVVYLRLNADTMFNGNSADLREDSLPILHFVAQALKASEDKIWRVNFMGHTAALANARGAVSSAALSSGRAANVCNEVINHSGFDHTLTLTTGCGRSYPIADNNTAEGRAKNRRVDIVVIGRDAASLERLLELGREYFPGDDTAYFEGDRSSLVSQLADNQAGEGAIPGKEEDILPELEGRISEVDD